MFPSREEAGKVLAAKLEKFRFQKPVVLAIPRGGVVVGYQVAQKLECPLEVVIARKVGAPHNPELACGAVTPDGNVLWNHGALVYLGLDPRAMQREVDAAVEEVRRRLKAYRREGELGELAGRVAIVVDDGVATGFTTKAALAYVRRLNPAYTVLAVPVAPRDALRELAQEADEVVCLASPEPFYAVGQFYEDFQQVSDDEVISLLEHRIEKL